LAGNHNDAILVIELAKLGGMEGVPQAARAIFADDFDPDAVEANDAVVRTVLVFFETVGTLVKNGLFNRELVYDWLWVAGFWARVGPAAKRALTTTGVDYLYANAEALAAGQA
jgi:hypothetical protein